MYVVCALLSVVKGRIARESKMAEKSRREEYMEATRAALLAQARAAFSAQGFAGASADAISRAARVTRGAFYHHFADKTAIFDAVVVQLEQEAEAEIRAAAADSRGLWAKLQAGVDAYLEICTRADHARIVITEAVPVLGVGRFQEIEEAHVLALLHGNIAALAARGMIDAPDPLLLARAVDAMICAVAKAMCAGGDPAPVRASGRAIIMKTLEGFKVR